MVNQHKPIKFNWAARFGLPDLLGIADSTLTNETYFFGQKATSPQIEANEDSPKKKLICHSCGTKISYKVGVFCWNNTKKFGGHAYCLDCQKNEQFSASASVVQ